ncbi:MAG: ribokinase, partial [Chloroflexi bacterium]
MGGKVVVVGSFNTDLVTYLPRLPQAGETVAGHEFVTGPGGKGSNQAVAAARLGGEVHFIGKVGQDSFADIGWQLWREHGIQTAFVFVDEGAATGIASIFVQENGENMIALAAGANGRLSPADIDRAEDAIRAADVLLVQLEVPLETVQRALSVARKHGVTTILNPAPAQPLPTEILALADYITPNEGELRRLTGVG